MKKLTKYQWLCLIVICVNLIGIIAVLYVLIMLLMSPSDYLQLWS